MSIVARAFHDELALGGFVGRVVREFLVLRHISWSLLNGIVAIRSSIATRSKLSFEASKFPNAAHLANLLVHLVPSLRSKKQPLCPCPHHIEALLFPISLLA